jgi:hypothetical protein
MNAMANNRNSVAEPQAAHSPLDPTNDRADWLLNYDGPADDEAHLTLWRVLDPNDATFFNLPLLEQLRHRPYYRIALSGKFDLEKLLHENRNALYRSEVKYVRTREFKVERLLFRWDQDRFAWYEENQLRIFAPSAQVATETANTFRRLSVPGEARARILPGQYRGLSPN